MDQTERDLDLAVELVNTHYALAEPPDQLTDVAVYQHVLRDLGERKLAGQLSPDDLQTLRVLRAELAPVFAADTVKEATDLLDRLLKDAVVPARLTASQDTARWSWDSDQHGTTALRARMLAALATHVIRHGTKRLGVCQADPCRCVFVDRSRARTRRYCCDNCNDRAAAAAYRRRNSR